MEQILTLVIPVFGVMAAGYIAGKAGILGQESSHALNAFVYYVAMPIMLFQAMADTDVLGLWDLNFFAIFVIPQFLVHLVYLLVAVYIFKQEFKAALICGMAASWGNSIYMGFPVALAVLGEDAVAAVVIIAVFQALIFMVGTLLILDISDGGGRRSPLKSLSQGFISFMRNPAMVAAMAGMFFSVTKLPLPTMLESFATILAPAAAPCALFAIGLFLTTQRLTQSLGEVSIITFLKLLISPALVAAVAYLVPSWSSSVSDLWISTAILLAAMPTGTIAFVIAQKHLVAEDQCSGSILLTSVFSILTIPLLISWL